MSVAVDTYDRAAARLHALVAATCDPDAPFVDQVATALRTTLDLFSAEPEPELARLLISGPLPDPTIAARQLSWSRAFAGLLRRAAMRSPDVSLGPTFVEPFLIRAITSLIARHSVTGPQQDPRFLLADLQRFVLSYYLPPEQAARAAATHRPELQTTDSPGAP